MVFCSRYAIAYSKTVIYSLKKDWLSLFINMAPKKKPAFLKTFSEFTIAELRAMPLRRVLTLFTTELQSTFTRPTDLPKPKTKQRGLKKTKQIKSSRKVPLSSPLKTLKRIISSRAVVPPADENTQKTLVQTIDVEQVNEQPKKEKRNKRKNDAFSETVVFSSSDEQLHITRNP